MALGVNAPSVLEPHISAYRETIKNANPVGATVNNQWLSSCFGLCGEDDKAVKELCTQSLKTFFGPGRPYFQDLGTWKCRESTARQAAPSICQEETPWPRKSGKSSTLKPWLNGVS